MGLDGEITYLNVPPVILPQNNVTTPVPGPLSTETPVQRLSSRIKRRRLFDDEESNIMVNKITKNLNYYL